MLAVRLTSWFGSSPASRTWYGDRHRGARLRLHRRCGRRGQAAGAGAGALVGGELLLAVTVPFGRACSACSMLCARIAAFSY